jgi:transposase InsO family protein
LTDLYALAGVSRQSLYKYRLRKNGKAEQEKMVIAAMEKMRREHTKMSSRKVYISQKEFFKITVGRDKFEQLAFGNGYRVKPNRKVCKTTWAQKVEIYPDLISGLVINNINQVYQSDIFYLKVSVKDFYGISIIDVYSRRLISLHISKSLKAVENVIAFNQVMKVKTKEELKGCIFHSDHGSQYISNAQKKMLKNMGMEISMCKMPQQNAYAERVQGSVKYEYYFERLLTEKNITRMTARIKKLYNEDRPHQNLNGKTPMEFEAIIKKLSESQRPQLKIYEWKD